VGLRQPSGLNPNAERGSTATRVSRVSFADGTRPSGEARRTGAWRDSEYVPPVPVVPSGLGKGATRANSDDSQSGTMSPTQTAGALTLTPEDIRARIAAGRARADSNAAAARKASLERERDVTDGGDDVLPALQMMRATDGGEYMFDAAPAPPAAAYAKPVTTSAPAAATAQMMSPVMHTLPMQTVPASVMSPDDMLRAYAERKKSAGAAVSGGALPGVAGSRISYPAPMAVAAPGGSPSAFRMSGTTTTSSTKRGSLLGALGLGSSSSLNRLSGSKDAAAPLAPMPPAATVGGKDGGRNIFSGQLSPDNTGGSAAEPQLGFAPGEYDAHFSFHQQQQPAAGFDGAYGGYAYADDKAAGNGGGEAGFAGRGAFRG